MAGSDLIPVYYLSATAASLVAAFAGAKSYNTRQRKKWVEEGAAAQKNTEALHANTAAAAANTTAISHLMDKLGDFADETRRELSNHHVRIERLEDLVEAPLRTRRTRPAGDPSQGRPGI